MVMMIQPAALHAFEVQFDPLHPEAGPVPARVLGYGEMSAALAIDSLDDGAAFKRMPMFHTAVEAAAYTALYTEAMTLLQEQVGLRPVPGEPVTVPGIDGRPVLYLVQPKLKPQAIANQALPALAADEQRRLFTAVLGEIARVFAFNRAHAGRLEIGLDGQLSNWVIEDFQGGPLPEPVTLAYLDTSSPLVQKNGVEQLDPELFLRSAPAFLRWIIRGLFLQDVLTRYYDQRLVVIDLIANLYKEQLPALVPDFVAQANEFWAASGTAVAPITVPEVQSYYRQDALIWRVYLAARRFDRFWHRLLGKRYPYLLPGKIKR